VRLVYETYTQQGLSINAIARMLNERQIPTRTGDHALGTIDRLGLATQPGVLWPGLLWQDRARANRKIYRRRAGMCSDCSSPIRSKLTCCERTQ